MDSASNLSKEEQESNSDLSDSQGDLSSDEGEY